MSPSSLELVVSQCGLAEKLTFWKAQLRTGPSNWGASGRDSVSPVGLRSTKDSYPYLKGIQFSGIGLTLQCRLRNRLWCSSIIRYAYSVKLSARVQIPSFSFADL